MHAQRIGPTAPTHVDAPEAASRVRHRFVVLSVLLALVLLAVLRSMAGTRLDSVTPDEPWHIVAGVEYHRTGDYRLNPEHPPLVKRWVGAFMPASFLIPPKTLIEEKDAERDLVEKTFFRDNDFRAAHRRARTAMFVLSALLLSGVGLLAWRVLGPAWAGGLLAFLALEPTVSAHLPVVMTDAPVALTLGMAALAAGPVVATWRWRWVVALGVSMGLALAAKHSALPGLIGIGAFVIGAAVWQGARAPEAPRRQRLRRVAARVARGTVAFLIALGVLWAWYGFQYHAGPDGSDSFNRPLAAKLAELRSPVHRTIIGLLDGLHILPRSYLWGLVDTIRAGVEGRGQNGNLLWGVNVIGDPPWYLWPSYLVAKMPLGLLGLAAAGALALRRLSLTPVQRAALLAVLAMALFHFIALLGSQGTYAGIRHALPIVVALGILAGAAASLAWTTRSRAWAGVTVGAFALTFGTTIGEPRLWEYHNVLAGGTEGAGYRFANEGVDLGQRAYEIAAFNDSVIAPSGEPLYANYWLPEEHARALGIPLTRRVEELSDTNTAGFYRGYFVYELTDEVEFPNWEWYPDEVFAGLEQVARFGYATIWHGEQTLPRSRAGALYDRIIRYIYVEGGTDWELVARRLEEVLAVDPHVFVTALELANAYIRLGRPDEALRAYRVPLAYLDRGIMDDATRLAFEQQIAKLERGEDVSVLRNPWLE